MKIITIILVVAILVVIFYFFVPIVRNPKYSYINTVTKSRFNTIDNPAPGIDGRWITLKDYFILKKYGY